MYIKNRRNSDNFKGSGSYQTLYLTESIVLRNRHKQYANRSDQCFHRNGI